MIFAKESSHTSTRLSDALWEARNICFMSILHFSLIRCLGAENVRKRTWDVGGLEIVDFTRV